MTPPGCARGLGALAVGLLLAGVLLVAGPGLVHAEDAAADPPNILLILTDDQGWPTLGSYGGTKVPTPNLDRLAAEGARFTDAYVTSQCTPTRATLLTGQYTARHRLWHVLPWYGYPWARMTEPAYAENYSRQTFTIAKGLRAAGYATAIVGKWHLTANEDGHYMGLNPEAAPHYGFDWAPPVISRDEFAPGQDRGVDTFTDQALDFIERHRDRPWFVYLSHHTIHGVVVAPDALTNEYRQRGYGDEGPWRAVYLAALEHLDRSIGRLMRRLEELGEAENTLVVFVSDNGGVDWNLDFQAVPVPNPPRPVLPVRMLEYDNEPLRAGKGSAYEGGVRVPFIARWPGHIPKGQVIGTPVHAVDLAPTFLEVAGAEATHPLDGVSLLPLLRTGDPGPLARRAVFQYYPFYDLRWALTPCATIRKGDWKLMEFFGDRFDEEHRYAPGHHLELYNLRHDVGERHNLAERRPDLTSALLEELHDWMDSLDAERPVENPNHDPSRAIVETKDRGQVVNVESVR
jgi:arylsulfatase A-like enzyme